MKRTHHILLFAFLVLNVKLAHGQRFYSEIFREVDSTLSVEYGSATNSKNQLEVLYLDFYQPSPNTDLLAERPLLIYAHGGGFTGGSRKWPSIRLMCEKMARRGYAVASISYRLDSLFNIFDSKSDKRAMTDAMHDMRAAIRFFKSHKEEFRIDTTHIFIGGESAGAITAMMAGYVDKQHELAAYPLANPNNIEGDSGHPDHSSQVKSILCLCGLMTDTSAIESPMEPSLFWAHGTSDPIVPISWAEAILDRAELVGLTHQKVLFEGATHCPWYYGLTDWPLYLDSLVNHMSGFLYTEITGEEAPKIKKALPGLHVADILQDNMVVQQDKPFQVWGHSAPGDEIFVKADWLQNTLETTTNSDGYWQCTIEVPKAIPGDFTPRTLSIANSRKDSVKLSNILIGDVWLCAGQSNMDMRLGRGIGYEGVSNYKEVIPNADYPSIRLFTESLNFTVTPQKDSKGKWEVCSPKTAGKFSAVAYFFGRELVENLNIPIGLIVSAVAGASAESFTPKEVLLNDALLREKYWEPRKSNVISQARVDSLGFFLYRPHGGYLRKVMSPTLSYNGMISPLLNLSIRGFLWYQGESNYSDREKYFQLNAALIKSWREKFNQGDLPFYFVQIAPYKNYNDSCIAELGYFWEAQQQLLALNNTGMALSMDVGDLDNIHPRSKEPIGVRLAKLALNRTYGNSNIQDVGPKFSHVKFKRRGVVDVFFQPSTIGKGLTTHDSSSPQCFVLAGEDHRFYPAQAVIKGNKIRLSSKNVPHPVAVRYGFRNDELTNLENKEGLPAFPFRTDEWSTCFYEAF